MEEKSETVPQISASESKSLGEGKLGVGTIPEPRKSDLRTIRKMEEYIMYLDLRNKTSGALLNVH